MQNYSLNYTKFSTLVIIRKWCLKYNSVIKITLCVLSIKKFVTQLKSGVDTMYQRRRGGAKRPVLLDKRRVGKVGEWERRITCK